MVFVDSNVILDVITEDPRWRCWSEEQLGFWLDRGPLLINPIVVAEIAFACDTIESVDDLLPAHLDAYRPIPRAAAFLAARAHAEDRARGGSRQTVLADVLMALRRWWSGNPAQPRQAPLSATAGRFLA